MKNVDKTNNIFTMTNSSGDTLVKIPEGYYTFKDLKTYLEDNYKITITYQKNNRVTMLCKTHSLTLTTFGTQLGFQPGEVIVIDTNAIYLICPTYEHNTSYKSYHTDEKFFVLPGPIENLDYHIDLVKKDCEKYHRSLIILDDVIGTTSVTSRTSKYVNLIIGARHLGASTITLTQQLNSLSKPARDQMTRLITFYNTNANDRKILHETFLADVSKEEFKKAMDYLRKNDYSYMDIDILHGTYKLV